MTLGLLLLHALPLDGSMWAEQRDLLPGATSVPTLYGFGDRIEDWAKQALKTIEADRLLVVGCSVGGSCAIEVALAAPERVAALVLIGTKAQHRPDPDLHARAVAMIREQGLDVAWQTFWQPLFSPETSQDVVVRAKRAMLAQSAHGISRGVDVFHSRPSRETFLAGFSKPVVVVTGAHDVAPGYEVSAAQAMAAPQGRLHVVPACGHYVPMERPNVVNEILNGLLAELA